MCYPSFFLLGARRHQARRRFRPAPEPFPPPLPAVDQNQVCSQSCLLKSFDLKTMKKEDAAFTVSTHYIKQLESTSVQDSSSLLSSQDHEEGALVA